MVALTWSMKHIYGMEPGETYWAASDVGWVVGHSYIVYAPLLYGCTTVLFEGKPVGTPDAGVFWRVIAEHDVKLLFTAPTAFRAIRRDDPEGKLLKQYDLSGLRALFLAGERSDPATLEWAEAQLGVPVIDHWWQTETGWPICSNCMGYDLLEIKHGSPARPVAGYDIRVLDEGGNEVPAGEIGALVIKTPCRPAHSQRFGTPMTVICLPISITSPDIMRLRTQAILTKTAISSSWPARMTSSMWLVTGSQLAAWRKCCRRTKM